MDNPFMNFKADANVSIPVYNELLGIHQVKADRVVVAYDSDNLANIPADEIIRDWADKNPCVYFLFTNALGCFHYRNYLYAYLKWDELRMNSVWNDKLHLFRPSEVVSPKPYAIYIGEVPIDVTIGQNPDGSPEVYRMDPGGRVPSVIGTAHTRKLYSITCKALGLPGCSDPMQLQGRECWIEVRQTYYNGKKKSRLHQISDSPIAGGTAVNVPTTFATPKIFGAQPDPLD